MGIRPNDIRDPNGMGIFKFGPDRVEEFLKQNNLELILRGHECVMDGKNFNKLFMIDFILYVVCIINIIKYLNCYFCI